MEGQRLYALVTGIFIASSAAIIVSMFYSNGFLALIGPVVVPGIMIVVLFTPFTKTKDADMEAVHHVLQTQGAVVKQRGGIETTVNDLCSLQIKECDGILMFRPRPSSTGWIVVFILLILPIVPGAIIPLVLYIFTKGHLTMSDLARSVKTIPTKDLIEKREDDMAFLRISGLSHLRRLASEAHGSMRSRYHDRIVLMVAFDLIVFPILLVQIYDDHSLEGLARAVGVVTLACASATLPIYIIVRRRWRDRLSEIAGWERRLSEGMVQESSGRSTEGSLELMLRASDTVLLWLEERRRAASYRDPGTWISILVLLCTAFSLLSIWIYDPLDLESSPFFVGGASCIAVSWVLYKRWKARTAREMEEDLRTVNERRRMLEERLGSLLTEGGR
jgi:hypothetical protein